MRAGDRQRWLVFDGTPWDDGVTLGGIGVTDGATLHLIMAESEGEPEEEPEPDAARAREARLEALQGA